MKQTSPLILASGSPRRSELLSLLGLQFQVAVTDIDESVVKGESPQEYACRLAREKALAGQRLSEIRLPSLGADTVVLLDGKILGKPVDRQHAENMLKALSGRDHEVLSAVALASVQGEVRVMLNTTRVAFSVLSKQFIASYCAGDEPMDKAGAYAIQGELGMYISCIEGSYSGVMGLPLFETGVLLRSAGILV